MSTGAQPQVQNRHTHWFPNSEATNKKPVFRTHMAVATGMVSKYFSRISVTLEENNSFLLVLQQVAGGTASRSKGTHHLFIRFQRNLEDVSLFCLGQEEEHGLGLVGGRTDEYHPSLWVI